MLIGLPCIPGQGHVLWGEMEGRFNVLNHHEMETSRVVLHAFYH